MSIAYDIKEQDQIFGNWINFFYVKMKSLDPLDLKIIIKGVYLVHISTNLNFSYL